MTANVTSSVTSREAPPLPIPPCRGLGCWLYCGYATFVYSPNEPNPGFAVSGPIDKIKKLITALNLGHCSNLFRESNDVSMKVAFKPYMEERVMKKIRELGWEKVPDVVYARFGD